MTSSTIIMTEISEVFISMNVQKKIEMVNFVNTVFKNCTSKRKQFNWWYNSIVSICYGITLKHKYIF